jgi:hypothetical protein
MEVVQVLCVAKRKGFTCTLEDGHAGEHQAWCEADLCASWSGRGDFVVFPEGDVSLPGSLSTYLDAVIAGRSEDEVELVS